MPPFNPFGKPPGRLKGSDLRKLRDVPEGWFIEYKGEAPRDAVRGISKAMCAFSNQHGGWLIFGVKPKNGRSKVPDTFPGLTDVEARELELAIRNSAQSVSPNVEYTLHPMKGPVDEIGLEEGREVLAVFIPEGARSPYIHSSGYIYRRFDDESRPETDRFAIESLYERSSMRRQELEKFLNWTPELSKGEREDIPYLHLYLMSDPLLDIGHHSKMKFDDFAAIMASEKDSSNFGISLENAFTMAKGYAARQIRGEDPYPMRFTWRYYTNSCSSLVSLPLSFAKIDEADLGKFLAGYESAPEFITALQAYKLSFGRVVDVCILLDALIAIVTKHRRLAHSDGIDGPFFGKAQLQNVWRTVPFWDSQGYVSFLKQRGFPVVQEADAMAPPGADYESMVELPKRRYRSSAQPTFRSLAMDAGGIFGVVVAALGIPFQAVGDEDLLKVGQRARERLSKLTPGQLSDIGVPPA